MSIVAIKKCKTYEKEALKKPFEELFSVIDSKEIKDKRILLFFDFPLADTNIFELTIDFLKASEAKEIIGGTSIIVAPVSKDLKELFKNEDIKFIDFRNDYYEKVEVPFRKITPTEHFKGFQFISPIQYQTEKTMERMDSSKTRLLKNVFLPVALTDSDSVVIVTKMKDSPIFRVGGFINSLLYLTATKTRDEIMIHLLDKKLADSILELFSIIREKVLFGVVDGIVSNVSEDSEVNKMETVLVSNDLISLDAVTSVLMGYKSSDVEINTVADLFNLGDGIFNKISLYGDDFTQIRKEISKSTRYSSVFTSRKSILPRIEKLDSENIEKVMNICPTGAILKEGDRYYIDKDKCFFCNLCVTLGEGIFRVG